MSRPRFLADHDLRERIVTAVLRREPAIEFARARDLGLARQPDPVLLATAASPLAYWWFRTTSTP
jgi:hypothetical protein